MNLSLSTVVVNLILRLKICYLEKTFVYSTFYFRCVYSSFSWLSKFFIRCI